VLVMASCTSTSSTGELHTLMVVSTARTSPMRRMGVGSEWSCCRDPKTQLNFCLYFCFCSRVVREDGEWDAVIGPSYNLFTW